MNTHWIDRRTAIMIWKKKKKKIGYVQTKYLSLPNFSHRLIL